MRSSMKPTLYRDFFLHTYCFFYRNAFLIMKLNKLPSFRAIQALIASQSMFEKQNVVSQHFIIQTSVVKQLELGSETWKLV